ncbi:fimbrial biogenesis chaperone [Klebsiella electrica]|uniref:fimbrial biogenesis chaperone n=1 Tax=Klebsiella electrica TaxID=1259973 RepID=UPI00114E2CC4|nr:molecular chaperone [Klebsiella electrica]QDI09309.1 Chaperone protein FocC precursor [Klebsiella electrica]WIO44854.1 molecular chaperone [Klebsiella electrica]
MKLLKLYFTGLLAVVFLVGSATAGVRPQLTRIVAYAQDRETAVDVINDSQETYMVQAWLEDLRGNDHDLPLVLTPPVMKLEGKKQGKFRLVVLRGAITQDRESAYWLSLQEIPPKAGSANKLVIAVRSRLKVFVRPDGLSSAGARDAIKQIRWSLEKDGNDVWLKATNPTPYYVSFARLSVGAGKGITLEDRHRMPPPFGSERYHLPASVNPDRVSVTWSGIHDWGGAGEEYRAELKQ